MKYCSTTVMLIEGFLSKVALAVLKNGIGSIAPLGLKAFEIYSAFEVADDFSNCIMSTNDCDELGVCALKVISDPLEQYCVDHLVEMGSETFHLENTPSGLYIASKASGTFRPSQFYGDLLKFFDYGSDKGRFFDYGKF